MTSGFDDALLARIEDAGVNASAPREQRWIDGWLVRYSPGKAKRAHCIQAVAAGRLPVEAKLARCLRVYERAGLRPYVRITPFSQPPGLDEHLAALGMERIDDTRVMVAATLADVAVTGAPAVPGPEGEVRTVDSATFAEWVGGQRGSSAGERQAHAERLRQAPVDHRALLLVDARGRTVAGGQVALEDDLVGLYDVFTAEEWRGRGLGRALCRALLRAAVAEGARIAYLQVEAGNAPARQIYRQLGFTDAYAYHYRAPAAP
ncbi:MAG: GNAT family N-acetyltransferase [Caldimonas sp.]